MLQFRKKCCVSDSIITDTDLQRWPCCLSPSLPAHWRRSSGRPQCPPPWRSWSPVCTHRGSTGCWYGRYCATPFHPCTRLPTTTQQHMLVRVFKITVHTKDLFATKPFQKSGVWAYKFPVCNHSHLKVWRSEILENNEMLTYWMLITYIWFGSDNLLHSCYDMCIKPLPLGLAWHPRRWTAWSPRPPGWCEVEGQSQCLACDQASGERTPSVLRPHAWNMNKTRCMHLLVTRSKLFDSFQL